MSAQPTRIVRPDAGPPDAEERRRRRRRHPTLASAGGARARGPESTEAGRAVVSRFPPRLIAVGFDPTPESALALERALELAERFGSRVLVGVSAPTSLVEPVVPGRPEPPAGVPDPA